ncbi:MAG: nitrogen fixation protein NifU [Candidatus Woesearchaeota archaeon]|nr:nitrogen fixation protein NifU [Candidatus Woesearchaeota archaeon]MDN5328064.1 nitrogen fixation protein NifU [Candidatus Woesearchaeota archaeon]
MEYDFLIERSEKPVYKGNLKEFNASFNDRNQVCGDQVEIFLKIEDGIIKDAKFDGKGCLISMASSDLLLEQVIGKSIDEVLKLDDEFIRKLVKVPLGVNRIKCATLPLKVLKRAVIDYVSKNKN